jgi:ornithine cyclodeaminase/alanine dehydrogenase-like protein (mu-crystallin family)
MLASRMLTAFLSRADVSRHMQALHLLRELRDAFTSQRHSASVQSLRLDLPAAPGSTVVRQATLPGLPAYAVTVKVEVPQQRPASRSVLQLHDATTGKLLAVMDATHLTSLRTSLMSALAAEVFSREDATNVAVLGSGLAASGALKALRLVRTINRVWLYEPDVAACTELTFRLQKSLEMAIKAADSAAQAVAEADIVVLTGNVSLPVDGLRAGTHVTVLAAETFAERPLRDAVWSSARRFCDASEPALSWGAFDASLADVLAKRKPGRATADELTLFASVGPAYLDLLAAWHVYEGARTDENLTRLDLEA